MGDGWEGGSVRQVNVVVKVTSDRLRVGNLADPANMGEAGIDSRTIQPQGVSRGEPSDLGILESGSL